MKILLLLFAIFQISGAITPQLQQAADIIQEIITDDRFALSYVIQRSDINHYIVYQEISDQMTRSIFDALIGEPSAQDLSLIDEMLTMLSHHHITLTCLEHVDCLGDYLARGLITAPQLPDFDFIAYPGEEGRLLLGLKDYLNTCEILLQDIYLELQGVPANVGTEEVDALSKIYSMLNFQTHEGKKNCEIFFGDQSFILFTPRMCTYLVQSLLQICQNNPETDFRQLFETIKRLKILFRTSAPSDFEYVILDCRLELSYLEQELERVDSALYQDYFNQRPASVSQYDSHYSSALYRALNAATDYCNEMQQQTLDILYTVRSDSLSVGQYSSEEILAR